MRLSRPTPSKTGSVLVAVLVVLALSAAILWLIQATALTHSQAVKQTVSNIADDALYLEALREGMQRLADDPDLLVDHPSEEWAKPFRIALPDGGELEIVIEDENRYFDLNNAPVLQQNDTTRPVGEILNDLFRICGIGSNSTELVSALVDDLDTNSSGSFEDPEDAIPANAPLSTWHDVGGVPGMPLAPFLAPVPDPQREREFGEPEHPRQIFTILPSPSAPAATTNETERLEEPSASDDRRSTTRVNLNTAPPHVLRGVVGNTPQRAALVEQFLVYRQETPIRNINAYLDRLPPADIEIASAYLDTKSSHFTISIRTVDRKRDGRQHASALVERDAQGSVRVLRWYP